MNESVRTLLWLIPLLPFLAFVTIILFTNQDKKVSAGIEIAAMFLSWLVSWLAVALAIWSPHYFVKHPLILSFPWFPTGTTVFQGGLIVDIPSAAMLIMVPSLITLISIYSLGYMEGDKRYSRFFAYLALFATGMLGLVISDNLLMFFIFWEIMGLCSYLLIGFWFEKKSAYQAGLKAFLTTRVGDVILMAGMVMLFAYSGSLTFRDIFSQANLEHLANIHVMVPIAGSVPLAVVLAILIFWGAIGKSAQFPLHVWLPDAMEGPTPVSALIHAATMVSAGVFLVVRTFPLFYVVAHGDNAALHFVAFIGAFTALFAATIAVAQFDIKRVLAYSTISQLGYMFAALGIGAYYAAIFHLLMHAFFKALLFLASGSVIHGMEHAHHHLLHEGHEEKLWLPFDPNDMRFMGGLLNRMPKTAWTFIAGGLSLSGFPLLFSGFWSKDAILGSAWLTGHSVVFWTLAIAAFFTAFYTTRQICMSFCGQPRTAMAEHVSESPGTMTTPLMIIALVAIGGGWFGIPTAFPGLGLLVHNPFHHFIAPYMTYLGLHVEAEPFLWGPLLVSFTVVLSGIFFGWLLYGWHPMKVGAPDPLEEPLGPLWTLLHNKYWIDEFYNATIIALTIWLARELALFDKVVIDGIVNGVGYLVRLVSRWLRYVFDEIIIEGIVNGMATISNWFGEWTRQIQTGQVQNYLFAIMLTLVVLLGLDLFLI